MKEYRRTVRTLKYPAIALTGYRLWGEGITRVCSGLNPSVAIGRLIV